MGWRGLVKALVYYVLPLAMIIYGFLRNPLYLILGGAWLGTAILFDVT